jgi:hypothetical protein
MSIGLNPGKTDIDLLVGSIVRALHGDLLKIEQIEYFLAGKTDGDLEALGYSVGEIAILRSAIADLAELATVYRGESDAPQKDFRTFARRLMGMGAV